MANPKVAQAVNGRAAAKARPTSAKTVVRFSSVPESADVVRLQEDVRKTFDKYLEGTPFKNGVLRTGFLTTEFGDVEHGLGKAARVAVMSLRPRANPPAAIPAVWEIPGDPARANTHVRVIASEPCDVVLWIWA